MGLECGDTPVLETGGVPVQQARSEQCGGTRRCPSTRLLTRGVLMRLLLSPLLITATLVANTQTDDIKSVSRLAVGPANVLFLADWREAKVHALALPDAASKPVGTAFNILDL